MHDILIEPQTIEELGVSSGLIHDMMFRMMFNEGDVSLRRFMDVMRISGKLLDSLLLKMQQDHFVEISKAGQIGRTSYVYRLTEEGMSRARDAMERTQYVGPVPVPIEIYNQAILAQTQERDPVTSAEVQQAIAHLILPEGFHRRIGPAINSGKSLFLYGPPGNGKTTISQAIAGLISSASPIWLPHSVTIGGQITMVYDRLNHKPIELSKEEIDQLGDYDHRWTLFERPAVMVGGELTMEALDLRYDETSKFYEAPLQLRHVPDRRLRTPADAPLRPAQPLDRAAGIGVRLFAAAHGANHAGAFPSANRVQYQPRSRFVDGRSVLASYPDEGASRWP
jgi:energy-coupling factor transporter ATP-binding protein EcfA2/DNA-binding PadR family transcriptional regulator